MAASSIRFGPGVTKEVGMDFKNLGVNRVCIVTDQNVAKLDAMKQAVEGLSREGIEFTVFDKVRVEPKDSSYVNYSPLKDEMRGISCSDGRVGSRKLLHLPNLTIQMLTWLSVSVHPATVAGPKTINVENFQGAALSLTPRS